MNTPKKVETRGRPRTKNWTPTTTHKQVLAFFHNDFKQMAEAMDCSEITVRRWFMNSKFPPKRIFQLAQITPFEVQELKVLIGPVKGGGR